MQKQTLLYTSGTSFLKSIEKAIYTLDVDLEKLRPTPILNEAQLSLLRSADLLLLDLDDLLPVIFRQLQGATGLPPLLIFTHQYTQKQYKKAVSLQPKSFLPKAGPVLQIRQAIELELLFAATADRIPPSCSATENNPGPRIYLKTGNVFRAVHASNITFAFSENQTSYIRVNQSSFPTKYRLNELETLFSPILVRVHRAFLANPSHISNIYPKKNKIEVEGTLIPIGNRYRESFFDHIRVL